MRQKRPYTKDAHVGINTRGKNFKQKTLRSGAEDILVFLDTYLVSCIIYNTHVFSIF